MTYGGSPLNLSAENITSIENMTSNFFTAFQSLNSGRTSGWTSAINIEALIEAAATNSGKIIECSSVLLGEYGYNGVSFGVPVSVGSEGIKSYEMPELTSEQKNRLDAIAAKLEETLSKIEY
ncbi:malate dehydrogenase [bioreactor metagenome]|uniref:Malate dehydrogenase n=1 Tax=bioreactor metagenome TaxID=1076179 RepID=A0A645EPV0_9ZZZZ